jgi:hypothetical protein
MSDMRWIGLAGGLLCAFIAPADTYGAAETRGAVPNFSSGDFPWVPTSPEYAPPASGPGPVTYDHAQAEATRNVVVQGRMRPADLSNPNLKPWVIQSLKKINDEVLAGKLRYASRASCRPPGVPEFLVHGAGFEAIHILQTAKKILLISEADTQIRHIYMNVPHSRHPTASYYGESIGHFEGDELIVDTIGFNDKTFLDDRYDVPHTTQLHVVERFKQIDDGKGLEVNFTVDDPGAFNAPWSGIVRYRHPAQPRRLEEDSCAEQTAAGFGENFPVPVAGKPDF